jgi:hypothetical protein
MKRYVTPVFMVAWLVLAATIGHAGTISFNFDNTDNEVGDHAVNRTAGVVDVGNWNNLPPGGLGTVADLIDSTGAATTADVTWGGTSGVTWSSAVVIDDADADDSDRMMKGYLDYGGDGAGENITIDITEIPYADRGYDLYVYHESSGGDGRLMSVSLDGGLTKVYAKDVVGIFQTDGQGFIEEQHATAEEADASDGGNYLVFRGLTAETLNIVTEGVGEGTVRSPVEGIQISEVPEPSTLVLVGLAAVVGLLWRRR